MTRGLVRLGIAALALATLAACGGGREPRRASVVTATDGWASVSADDPQRSFVYVTLLSDADDRLVGASVPATVGASTSVVAGVSTGEAAGGHLGHLDGDGAPDQDTGSGGIALDRGTALVLEPGAGRIVIDDLATPLRDGDRFAVTLRFDSGATLVTDVVVGDGPPPSEPAAP